VQIHLPEGTAAGADMAADTTPVLIR
jgi:hypothetical protein